MKRRSGRLALVAVAVAGIVFAIAVTWATSQIVSQPVGLSSEPVTVGLHLAPTRRPGRRQPRTPANRQTSPSPSTISTALPAPEAPSGESGREAGDNGSGSDD